MESALTGYGGPVPLVVGFNPDGTVRGVVLLDNHESLSFIAAIKRRGLLDAWNGLRAAEALTRPVDAVSGATISSGAIIAGVRDVVSRGPGELSAAVPASRQPLLAGKHLAGAGIVVFCVVCFFLTGRLGKVRPVQLIVCMAGLGLWCGSLLSLDLFASWLQVPRAALVSPVVPLILLLTVLFGLIFGRNFYCVHVCPYGCAQELAAGIVPVKKKRVPRRLVLFLRVFRGSLLLGVAGLLLFGQRMELDLIEPFAAFAVRAAPLASVALALAFLALSVRFPRLWCRTACPTGMVLGMLCPPRREKQ
jgi:hypothetical protein